MHLQVDTEGGVGDKPVGDRDSDANLLSSLFVGQAHLFFEALKTGTPFSETIYMPNHCSWASKSAKTP